VPFRRSVAALVYFVKEITSQRRGSGNDMSRLGQSRPMVSLAESVVFPDRFFGSVVLGGGGGWLLDLTLDTFPWLASMGTVLGMVLGFYMMVVLTRTRDGANGR
jgi:F0F1-type ATP synthase assembly protein I